MRSLVAGDHAPTFEVVDPLGGALRSEDLLRARPILLTFYRGAWCPCCQTDLRDIRKAAPVLQTMDLTVLGAFHELSAEGCTRIHEEYEVGFPLVDDPQGRAAHSFGIRRSAEDLAQIEEELGPDVLALREGQPWIMPMQARYLIARDGAIVHAELVGDYRERADLMSWLPAVEGLR